MFRKYEEALEYLYANLPMFQRIGAAALKPDLTNTLKLCEALGNPQRKYKTVHVAGTNGKGSSSHMLASIFQEAEYKTGLYTSPHLKSFTERIRINGQEVSQTFVVDFVNRIRTVIEEIKPSFFEITVAMAFDYFAQQAVDIAVIEVGLGGRLDSTNIITPEVSLITNIGWDHKDLLGDTLEKIAFEKAGIIKNNIPVVISERQPVVEKVFIEKAYENDTLVRFASDQFSVKVVDGRYEVWREGECLFHGIDFPLKGNYQFKNIPGVIAVVETLKTGDFKIGDLSIIKGLENVVRNTKLKGRWQKLQDSPMVICDTGHNIDGISQIVRQIETLKYSKLHFVFGVVKDKSIDEILAILPKNAIYYFCQAKLPRALDAGELANKALSFGLQGFVIPDVNAAKISALKNAAIDDLIFIGGSTFVVAEINEL